MWKAKRESYRTTRTDENVLSYYDDDAPELLSVSWEPIPGGKYSIIITEDTAARVDPSYRRLINGQYYWEIQPFRYIDTVDIPLPWQIATEGLPSDWFATKTVITEAELLALMSAIFYAQNSPHRYPTDHVIVPSGGGSTLNNVLAYYPATPDWPVTGAATGSTLQAHLIPYGAGTIADSVTYQKNRKCFKTI